MIVISHATDGLPYRDFLHDAWLGIVARVADHGQDFTSSLYRDPDAVGVLHVHLPDIAAQMVRAIRLADVKNRLFVTIPDDDDIGTASKLRGDILLAGADDAQPVSIDEREIVLRLRAIMARGQYIDHLHVELPRSVFNWDSGKIETRDGRSIRVPPKAGGILVELARHPGETRTKQQIMDALYGGGDDEPEIKIVDVLVCKLRQKIIEATGGLDCVQTVWGRGYQFVPDGFAPEYRQGRAVR